ncbi:hypothetical protein [Nocardioides jejuensis]|uniref:Uncharacterized protein n=1 Tax=Nocardioides jejuensis TaxID=2502782 RepID=A0A4R1CJU2_9ACTN|nr:hypothetical protein [Nocardioides jejuensis]TCJ31147.1 hypothetical protein EPD65_00820 [Nocardioides jejuensis]
MAHKSEARRSTWRDGLLGVSAGTALAAVNLLHFSSKHAFVRPGTWPRVLFVLAAGALALAAWHKWLKGQPTDKRGHSFIPLAMPLLVSASLYLAAALIISHLRSEPVPMNLGAELAGRAQVQPGKGDPVVDLANAVISSQLESNQDVETHYKLYAGASKSADYVGAMTMSAYRNTALADGLADDYDDRITQRLLGEAINVDAGESLKGVRGHFRCGEGSGAKGKFITCVFAHGVSAAVITMPTTEPNPRDLARRMILDLLER